MTYGQLLKEAAERLEAAGVDDPQWDAQELLAHAGGPDRTHFPLQKEEEVPQGVLFMFDAYVGCRANRIPLQHILGECWFMGLPFKVDETVLIPRQDTEVLVEKALELSAGHPEWRVLDLCTGSGAIGISLAKLGGFERVYAADLSAEALALARENAVMNRVARRMVFACGDLLAARPEKGEPLETMSFDLICCNPPYIPSGEIETLEPEVKDHDPLMALDGGADGLSFYRRLARELRPVLAPEGRLLLEIGCEQGQAVSGLLTEAGFREVRVLQDLAGLDRVVTARR